MTRQSWNEAKRYVLTPLFAGALLLALGRRSGWLGVLAAAVAALFFRDPERPLVPEPGVVYAAADGAVTGVEKVRDPWLPGGEAVRISTFLSLHDVHVNRSPVSGRVVGVEEVKGGFFPALFERSGENHRNRIAIDGEFGRVVVVQISGMIARRIACWVGAGDRLRAGQRIGLIHFGSRTDVLLPAGSAEVLVRPGERVRAGATPLARYRRGDA